MTDQVWTEYLAATQRLDAVGRDAAAAAAQEADAAKAARGELARLTARLGAQQARLRAAAAQSRAADPALVPSPADIEAANRAIGDDPAAVLDALRGGVQAVDAADAAVEAAQAPRGGLAAWPPRLRNLVVYGPLALFVLAAQLVLYAVADSSGLSIYLSLCGLVMPAAAFGVGFVTIGLIFPGTPGERVDRTPLLGAAVCLASVVLMCAGLSVLAISP